MVFLPIELMFNVFLKTNIEAVFACRCVCRSWRDLIDSESFIQSYHNISAAMNNPQLLLFECRQSVHLSARIIKSDNPPESFTVCPLAKTIASSSCRIFVNDGYILIQNQRSPVPLFLFNPSRGGEVLVLPTGGHDNGLYGLGYDTRKQTYKVVNFYEEWRIDRKPKSRNITRVLELGSTPTSWREISAAPPRRPHFRDPERAISANGDLHLDFCNESSIVSFDVEEETFRLIPYPEFSNSSHTWKSPTAILNFKGNLCAARADSKHIEIWRMRDYQKKEWELECKIEYPTRIRDLFSKRFSNFGQEFQVHEAWKDGIILSMDQTSGWYYYNAGTEVLSQLIPEGKDMNLRFYSYTGNLASLKKYSDLVAPADISVNLLADRTLPKLEEITMWQQT